ncbi:unnamed protein product [Leuciscus chuanchicus]
MEVRDQMSMPSQLWTAYTQPVGFWVSESQTNPVVQIKGGNGGPIPGTQKKQTSTQTQSHEASFNRPPHLAVPMEFTHNALCLHYSSSPLPQSRLTSSLNTPRHLYIQPTISQALSVLLLASSQCVLCGEKTAHWEQRTRVQEGPLGNRLRLFHSHPWTEDPQMTNQIQSMLSPGSYCLRLLSIPEASLSLLFPRLHLRHTLFSPSVHPSIISFHHALHSSSIHQ